MSTPSAPPAAAPTKAALLTLLGAAAADLALAIYQWFELLELRRGRTPGCAVNETINCATVWNSAFASRVHEATGIPIAGLGVAWALAAVVFTLWLWRDLSKQQPWATAAGAVKVWAAVGALATITFITASLRMGAACPTCIGTYVLVGLYAFAALGLLPKPLLPLGDQLVPSGARAALVGTACTALMLYPGSQTPRAVKETLDTKRGQQEVSNGVNGFDAAAWFASLPGSEGMFAANARQVWRTSETPDISGAPPAFRDGPADAKVRIVDFTDVLCGHCSKFEQLMTELAKVVPPGSFSIEPRYFPLDAACNASVERRNEGSVPCVGAKVQVCLEKKPELYHRVRHELFARQTELTPALVEEIALNAGADRMELESCVNSPATQARLDGDIRYALAYHLDGTPLVIINGRKTEPSPAFILGMILSGGDPDSNYFAKLPPPPGP